MERGGGEEGRGGDNDGRRGRGESRGELKGATESRRGGKRVSNMDLRGAFVDGASLRPPPRARCHSRPTVDHRSSALTTFDGRTSRAQ